MKDQVTRLTKTAVRLAMEADQKRGFYKDLAYFDAYAQDLKPYVSQLLQEGVNPIHVPRKAFKLCYHS